MQESGPIGFSKRTKTIHPNPINIPSDPARPSRVVSSYFVLKSPHVYC